MGLRPVGGAPIDVDVVDHTESSPSYVVDVIRPRELLGANVTYEVLLVSGDSEPYAATTFATNATVDDAIALFSGPITVQPTKWQLDRVDDCVIGNGGFDTVVVEHGGAPVESASFEISLHRADETAAFWRIVQPVRVTSSASYFETTYCALLGGPIIEEGTTYCARVRAFDLAGNVADAPDEACAAPRACATDYRQGFDGVCHPVSDGGGCGISTRSGKTGPASLIIFLAIAAGRRRRPSQPAHPLHPC